jgi:alkylated DNA repair dioxygenase AlkB
MAIRRLRGAREAPLFASFCADPAGETIVAGDGDVRLHRGWLARERADALLDVIRRETPWRQERRVMYDRTIDVPREQAWYGDHESAAGPLGPELTAVARELEALAGVRFPYVLLNRYRNGADSVAWHADREGMGLSRPVIGSLTLGATRAFDLRSKSDRARVISVDLDHGDLLVMAGATQLNYEHRIRKDARIAGERINLTFREARIEQEFDRALRKGSFR